MFNIKKLLPYVHALHLGVLYGYQNNQQLSPYTALNNWFYS